MISIRKMLATLSLAAFATVGTAPAAILIDSFDTDQGPLTVNTGTVSISDTVAGAGILGGERDLMITYDGGPFDSVARVAGGFLSISNDIGNSSTTMVTWDGVGAAGLGGVDLTGMGAFGIAVEVILSDLGGTLDLTLTDTVAGSDTAQIILPAVAAPTTFNFLFAGFAGVDLTSIDSIKLQITGPGALDVGIDFIETAVPEPTSMILLGTALLGLGIRRRYAKK